MQSTASLPLVGDDDGKGFWAQVLKTTDGGGSWSVVYEDIDNGYYPNDISCSSETQCTFVLEGVGRPKIMTTSDGGATWEAFEDASGGSSLMPVRSTKDGDVWVAGGGDTGRFWHLAPESGAAWESYEVPKNTAALVTSFSDFAKGVVFGTAALASQLCSVFGVEV